MIDRNFKKKCLVEISIGVMSFVTTDIRGAKKLIYQHGVRGCTYKANVITEDGQIIETHLLKYTQEGPIFCKQTYSYWKELKTSAEAKQFNIFLQL